MDLLLSWLFFGSAIGLSADFIEITPAKQHFIASLLFGIAGAVIGGGLGFYINQYFSLSVPPSFYMLTGSLLLTVIPKKRISRPALPQELSFNQEKPLALH